MTQTHHTANTEEVTTGRVFSTRLTCIVCSTPHWKTIHCHITVGVGLTRHRRRLKRLLIVQRRRYGDGMYSLSASVESQFLVKAILWCMLTWVQYRDAFVAPTEVLWSYWISKNYLSFGAKFRYLRIKFLSSASWASDHLVYVCLASQLVADWRALFA